MGAGFGDPSLAKRLIVAEDLLGADGKLHQPAHGRDRVRGPGCAKPELPADPEAARSAALAAQVTQGLHGDPGGCGSDCDSVRTGSKSGSDEEWWSRVGFGVVGVMHHRCPSPADGPREGPPARVGARSGGFVLTFC